MFNISTQRHLKSNQQVLGESLWPKPFSRASVLQIEKYFWSKSQWEILQGKPLFGEVHEPKRQNRTLQQSGRESPWPQSHRPTRLGSLHSVRVRITQGGEQMQVRSVTKAF